MNLYKRKGQYDEQHLYPYLQLLAQPEKIKVIVKHLEYVIKGQACL